MIELSVVGHKIRILRGVRDTSDESMRLERHAPPGIYPLQEGRSEKVSA